jgi:hypothetical protein
VSAVYTDDSEPAGVELKVRFHTKINRFGDMLDQGWSEMVEGVNRLIFDKDELYEKGVIPANGGVVTLSYSGGDVISLVLHVAEPDSGPIEAIWQVSQQ